MIRSNVLSFTLVLFSFSLYGQTDTIKGITIDKKRNPILACNVIIKGTTIGTVTDTCGTFKLPFNQDKLTLLFHSMSYVDLRTFEVEVNKSDISTERPLVFQLGNFVQKNEKCKPVDKRSDIIVIE